VGDSAGWICSTVTCCIGLLWIAGIVQPGIRRIGPRVAFEVEDFHDPIPASLTLKNFLYGHAFTVRSFRTVELVNDGFEFVYVAHAVASTKSPTLHVVPVTPAAIAGVQRSVL
jgi:hypothetical protein